MNGLSAPGQRQRILLVYYSGSGRERIEAILRDQRLEVYLIDGRAADAADMLRDHPAKVVVMDHNADDISVGQAVRQVGQILPLSLVIAVHPGRSEVDMYWAGHRIGVAESLEAAIRPHSSPKPQEPM